MRSRVLALLMGVGLGLAAYGLVAFAGAEWSLIFIGSLVSLVVSAVMLQKDIKLFNLRNMTVTGFFYFSYVISIFFPALFIYAARSGPSRVPYLLSMALVPPLVALGVRLTNKLCAFHSDEIARYFERPVVYTEHPALGRKYTLLLCASLIFFGLYLLETPSIPLLGMFKGWSNELLTQQREDSFKLLGSSFTYFYAWTKATVFPVLILISAGAYRYSRERVWLIRLLAALFPGLLFAAASIEKSHVAGIFAMLFFLYYLENKGRIGWRSIGYFFVAVFAFPVTVVYFLYPAALPVNIVFSIARRLFYVPATVQYYYFELFPKQHEFLMGRSIGKFAALLGESSFNTANYVYRYLVPNGIASGQSNAGFMANAWADFGIYGVFFTCILVGILLQGIQVSLVRSEKTHVNLAIYAFVAFRALLLNWASLFVVLLTHGLLLVFFLRWFLNKKTGKVTISAPRRALTDGRKRLA